MSDSIPPDIQIEQDIHHQRRVWKIERIGWMVMGIIIIAACLGLFGGAGLFLKARTTIPGQEHIQVEYERFGRFLSPVTLKIYHTPQEDIPSFSIWFDEAYMQYFTAEQITPMPQSVLARNGRLLYSFAGQPQKITFTLKPVKIGTVSGKMGVTDETHKIRFHQLIYP